MKVTVSCFQPGDAAPTVVDEVFTLERGALAVVCSLFGALRRASPRWWHCSCTPGETRTFSPVAGALPQRTTPELQYLEANFAGLASYGLSANCWPTSCPLGRPLHATAVPPLCSGRSPNSNWKPILRPPNWSSRSRSVLSSDCTRVRRNGRSPGPPGPKVTAGHQTGDSADVERYEQPRAYALGGQRPPAGASVWPWSGDGGQQLGCGPARALQQCQRAHC